MCCCRRFSPAGLLVVYVILLGAGTVVAQSPDADRDIRAQPSVLPHPSPGTPSFAELEARISELERARQAERPARGVRTASAETIADPALRSVEEQTRRSDEGNEGNEGDDTRSLIRDWINRIQDPAITTVEQQTRTTGTARKSWFDRLSIRGYTQFRINEVLSKDPDGAIPQNPGDSSIGLNQSFLIRRARIILSGDVSDFMYVYIQPDFASSVPGVADATYFAQLRDCFADLYLDREKVHRIRVGQSKVPYGWENLQSSSSRLPLDRTDALNSAVRNERDLGVFYYYTPDFAQDLFKEVLEKGWKGSGNYGLFGIGVYNGQGGSLREQNDNLHVAARLAVPFQFANCQVVELGAQAYTGKYTVLTSPIQPLGVGAATAPTADQGGYLDQRVAGTIVYYPQPIGFQAEWNVGRGPELNDTQTAITVGSLEGGYAMVMYQHKTEGWGTLFPFARYQHYSGGYKAERNAPQSRIDEWELGVEWAFNPQMELTAEYTFTDRTNTTALSKGESYRQFDGDILRVQFQVNY